MQYILHLLYLIYNLLLCKVTFLKNGKKKKNKITQLTSTSGHDSPLARVKQSLGKTEQLLMGLTDSQQAFHRNWELAQTYKRQGIPR